MNQYALRAAQQDWEVGIAMLIKLGVLAESEDGRLYEKNGGNYRFIGPIHRIPTGQYDETGSEIMGPVTDDQGRVYWHANLETEFSLRAIAEASTDPAIQQAVQQIAKWVLTDENGNARIPNNPAEVIWR